MRRWTLSGVVVAVVVSAGTSAGGAGFPGPSLVAAAGQTPGAAGQTSSAAAVRAPAEAAVPGGQAPGAKPAPPPQSATEPFPRNDNRHRTFLDIARGSPIELLFVGDSITDAWRHAGQTIWDQHFAPLKAANFGISGDTTGGVLWRMQNGELEGYTARLIVMMLGTNNISRSHSNDDIVLGLRLIVQEFRARQPKARVLLLGIFPRSAEPTHPYRAAIKDINGKLAKLADDKTVFFMDIGDRFLAPDGTLPAEIMPDGLHPNFRGYQIWADAMAARIRQLMR